MEFWQLLKKKDFFILWAVTDELYRRVEGCVRNGVDYVVVGPYKFQKVNSVIYLESEINSQKWIGIFASYLLWTGETLLEYVYLSEKRTLVRSVLAYSWLSRKTK